MRKTSQDGGDSTSITSGVENEIKKAGAIIKSKRNSIKRKVQSLSHESDDTVIEPLLQKEKQKTDTPNQSAKNNLLSKTKTDIKNGEGDKAKLLQNDKILNSLDSDTRKVSDTIIPSASSNVLPKYTGAEAPLHNHMNTNVFNSPNTSKNFVTAKSQAILEIDGSKQTGYSPSTLIFTTAKIHTSDKIKHMEPVQVTPVPIVSITEGSILKGIPSNNSESSAAGTSNVSTIYANSTNASERDHKSKIVSPTVVAIKTPEGKIVDIKSASDKNIPNRDNKNLISGSNLTSNNLKDPSAKENINESSAEKKEMYEKLSKSQPVNDSSSDKIKCISSSMPSKSITTTTAGTTNYTNKTIATDKVVQTTKTDTSTVSKTVSERETDFNKNMKSFDSREPSRSVGSSNKSIISTSGSTKQLQRQKTAIDKDDTKLKSSANNSSPTVCKIETKPQDIVTKNKLPTDDVNSSKNATKLPISSNNVHVISPITTVNSKPMTTNSTIPMSTIVTAHNSTILIPASTTILSNTSSIAKPSSSNVTTSRNGTKPGDILSLKPAMTSTIANKPPVSTTSASEKMNAFAVGASTNNSFVKAPSISTTTAKSPSVLTSTSKTSPASATKANSVSENATKISTLPPTTSKVTSASVSSTKASSVFTNVTNESPMNLTKIPTSSKSTAKASSASKTSTPGLISDTTSRSPPVSAVTSKKSTEVEKNAPTISKENVRSPITSSSKLATETPTSIDQTLKSLPSNKKGEELSNGNKNLNI